MSATACPSCAAPVSPNAASCALCDAVIRELPPEPRARPRRSARPPLLHRVVRPLLWLAGGAFVCVAGTAVAVASLAARAHRVHAARALDTSPRQPSAMTWPELERTAARSASFARGAAPDRGAARQLLAADLPALQRRPHDVERDAALDADTSFAAAEAARPGDASMRRRIDLLVAAPAARLTAGQRALLAGDTASRYLAAYRRAAAGGELPRMWPYRADLGGAHSYHELPRARYTSTTELAYRNAAAALLALDAGDMVTAERRARENIAMGHAQLRMPFEVAGLIGRVMVRRGGELLARVGRASADQSLVREGEALVVNMGAVNRDAAVMWRARMQQAGDSTGAHAAGDTTLAPGLRVTVALSAMAGTCQSPRELLLGPDAERRAMLRDAGVRLADIDADGRLARLVAAEYDAWNARANAALDEPAMSSIPVRRTAVLLRAVGFGGLAGRLHRCEMAM